MIVITDGPKPIFGALLMVLSCMRGACGDGGGSGAGADVPAGWQEHGEADVYSIRTPEG